MATRKQAKEFMKQHDRAIQETMPEFSEWCSALRRHLDNGTEYEAAVEKAWRKCRRRLAEERLIASLAN